MIPLNDPALNSISNSLQKYDLRSTVKQLASLLTVPSLQANTVRIDLLIHLATLNCHGKRTAGLPQIQRWLNECLNNTNIVSQEDPVENVFVSNITTSVGNFRIFEGIWESNQYFLQTVIDTLYSNRQYQVIERLLESSLALLQLSDHIAQQLNLSRWHNEDTQPGGEVKLTPSIRILGRARKITFSNDVLKSIGVNRTHLKPFILSVHNRESLREETIGNSSLEKCPLIELDDELIFSLPHATSPSIRRQVLTKLQHSGQIKEFTVAIANYQAQQIQDEVLPQIQRDSGTDELLDTIKLPKPESEIPPLYSWLGKYDIDKFIHIILLHDLLDQAESQRLDSQILYPDKYHSNLSNYLEKISSYCWTSLGCKLGTTLVVGGGIGREHFLQIGKFPDNWNVALIGIYDLVLLAQDSGKQVTKFLKCLEQKTWAESHGVEFLNVSGDFNFYCFWRCWNFQLISRDLRIEEGTLIVVLNDYLLAVRSEFYKRNDNHAAQTTDGTYVPVTRFTKDSHFKSRENRPIYVSIKHIRAGVLAAVVESSTNSTYWLILDTRQFDQRVKYLLYKTWAGILDLFDDLVSKFEEKHRIDSANTFEIRLNFDEIELPEYFADLQTSVRVDKPQVSVDVVNRVAEVRFPPKFLLEFTQPENTGESLILCAIANCVLSLYQGAKNLKSETAIVQIVESVLCDPGARVIHLFQSSNPIEHLLAAKQQHDSSTEFSIEDYVFSKLKLTHGCKTGINTNKILGKNNCIKFLNCVVEKLWKRIRNLLNELDRESVIKKVLDVHESKISEKDQWDRTSKALLALHGSEDDVVHIAHSQESNRTTMSLLARTILEMAICECPVTGGRCLSRWDLDELFANVMLLLEAASESDAVYKNLNISPRIQLHQNGEYTINSDYKEHIVKPFFSDQYDWTFNKNIADYSNLYQTKDSIGKSSVEKNCSKIFLDAFQAEFGLTLQNAVDGFAILLDIAIEKQNAVVETTLDEVYSRMYASKNIPLKVCKKFISTFCLFHRSEWNSPPSDFNKNDIWPWNYKRRLSATTRPILVSEEGKANKVYFGVGTIVRGALHTIHNLEQGGFPNEFFTSIEMKRYVGTRNKEKGFEFTNNVAGIFRQSGWQVHTEVQMTQFAAPSELGDVDVLAWSDAGQVQVIECKHLYFARTIAEIAEICSRLKGDEKDELGKHVARVEWIKANLTCLKHTIGFVPEISCLEGYLITSARVPIQYLESLPISSERIISFAELNQSVERRTT